jgi:hypothetical protein
MRSPAIQGRHDREEPYVLDEQVGFALRQAQQRHTTIFAAKMIEDLTPTQWAALAKLRELGDCSQNHLGRLTAMDAATIKGVVDRLTARHRFADHGNNARAAGRRRTLDARRFAAAAVLRRDNRGCILRGRRVAAAMGAHDAVDDRHADTR